MIVRPGDVHEDAGRARFGVGLAAEALGVECDLRLSSQWLVKIDPKDGAAFLALAREEASRE